MLKDNKNQSHIFEVLGDKQLFQSRVAIPSIEMLYDNDQESEWQEIGNNVNNMTLSLSIAAYDYNFGHQ